MQVTSGSDPRQAGEVGPELLLPSGAASTGWCDVCERVPLFVSLCQHCVCLPQGTPLLIGTRPLVPGDQGLWWGQSTACNGATHIGGEQELGDGTQGLL